MRYTRSDAGSKLEVWMSIVVSLIMLLASVFIIMVDSYSEQHSEWAFGMAGLVVGYWLR